MQTAEAVAAAKRSARAEALAEADEVAAQHGAAMAILQARVAAAKGAGTDGATAEAQALSCDPLCIEGPP